MQAPTRFSGLPEYAFPRLRELLVDIEPVRPDEPTMKMSIGEPQHTPPEFALEAVARHAHLFAKYPNNYGDPKLLSAICDWFSRRYQTSLAPENLMVLNGSREGLFNAALALLPETKNGKPPKVLIPNPFYQAYMMGARTVGAEPVFINTTRETGFLPDLEALETATLDQTGAVFLCSPSNPQGAIASEAYWKKLITLAERHDFYIFADECYSEIYAHSAPVSALQVAVSMTADPERVIVFNSLSKRSNLPGFRSGFVAGGEATIARLRILRAYAGAPVPMPIQLASAELWSDEAHVEANRKQYHEKFTLIAAHFGRKYVPDGGFFLWLPVEDGETATRKLWREQNIQVLPGGYLAQDVDGKNPGKDYIRAALVGTIAQIAEALPKIGDVIRAE